MLINAVGYAGNTLVTGYSIVVPQFDCMTTADGAATLGDFVPAGNWMQNVNTLVIKNAKGNQADVDVNGTIYKAKFVYVSTAWFEQQIADLEEEQQDYDEGDDDWNYCQEMIDTYTGKEGGWYIKEGAKTYWDLGHFNAKALNFGEGVMVDTIVGATITTSGEVSRGTNLGRIVAPLYNGYTQTGNLTPVEITLGDFIPGGNWMQNVNTLVIKNAKGNQDEVDVDGTKYKTKFIYVSTAWFEQQIADLEEEQQDYDEGDDDWNYCQEMIDTYTGKEGGWYIKEGAKTYWDFGNFNARSIPAGYGVFIDSITGSTLSVPAALK